MEWVRKDQTVSEESNAQIKNLLPVRSRWKRMIALPGTSNMIRGI